MEIPLAPADPLTKSSAVLLPDSAVLLPQSKALIIADLHLGKSATFRQRGLPVPEGSTKSDLERLTRLLERHTPSQLIIAGDLFHSADGLTPHILQTFRTWLSKITIPVTLTEGNHDRRASLPRQRLPFETIPNLTLDGIFITHDPADLTSGQAGIAGHLHPGAKIAEPRRQPLRVSGFYLKNKEHLILPAFSEFTGIHPIRFRENDHFYTKLGDRICEIPQSLLR